jgi:endonuclease-3
MPKKKRASAKSTRTRAAMPGADRKEASKSSKSSSQRLEPEQKKVSRSSKSGPLKPDMQQRERVVKIIDALAVVFPDARCALNFSNPLELLIATILAAQCTDKKVNEVTETLFEKYKSAGDFASADQHELEIDIKSTGFFRNKTKSIKRCCRSLIEHHNGEVPKTMEELVSLGGVGRKTANVVLGNAYGIPGIIVDTHVLRLSRRMGLSEEHDADKVERDLMAIVPQKEWTHFSHLLADLGRSYCQARKPLCNECPVEHLCPKVLEK